jgi:predicted dehydrogenase
VNVALLGAGNMGSNHFRILQSLSKVHGFHLKVYDPDPEIAAALRDCCYLPEDEIFDWMDACVIATPIDTHKDLCLRAIEQGAAVLCEKPLCDNSADIIEVYTAARERDTVLMVGFTERYNPVVRGLFALMFNDDGDLGDVLRVEICRVGNLAVERYRAEGVVVDLAVHDFDLLVYFFGTGIKLINDEAIVHGPHMTPVFCLAQFMIPENTPGMTRTSWIDVEKRRTITLYTSTQVVEADLVKQIIRRFNRREPMEVRQDRYPGEPLLGELETFISAAKAGRAPLEKDSVGLRAVQIVEDVLSAEYEPI